MCATDYYHLTRYTVRYPTHIAIASFFLVGAKVEGNPSSLSYPYLALEEPHSQTPGAPAVERVLFLENPPRHSGELESSHQQALTNYTQNNTTTTTQQQQP
jgi:hypothetical protein